MTSTTTHRSLWPLSERSRFIILIAGWVVTSALLLYGAWKFRYVMSNIDGIQYIRIAEHYAAGRFGDAFNAYWSPMISWSMLPFMAVGIGSQLAFFLASATWAIIGVGIGTWFVWRRGGHSFWASAITMVFLYILYGSNLINLTPDLLVITWTIGFAWVLVEVNDRLVVGTFRSRVWWGILLGAVMAIGYFVKAFDVPVFIVVGLGWLGIRMLYLRYELRRDARERKSNDADAHGDDKATDADDKTADDKTGDDKVKPDKTTPDKTTPSKDAPRWRDRVKPMLVVPVVALIALFVISAPFVTALSVKYGGFTFGSSFQVNFSSHKFGDTSHDENYTADSLQLPPPPNAYAISFGEDRTAQLTLPNTDSGADVTAHQSLAQKATYYAKQRVDALPVYLENIQALSPFAVPLIAVVLGLFAFRYLDPRRWRAVAMVSGVFVVYFLGYAAIIGSTGGNFRYYWPLSALSTIVAALLWPALWRRARRSGRWWRPALAILLIALIPLAAIDQLALARPAPFSDKSALASLGYLRPSASKYLAESYEEKLAGQLLSTGVIEPHSKIVGSNGEQRKALVIAFYMRSADVQIYGRTEPHNIADPRFQAVMVKDGIDYYFDFRPENRPKLDVSGWGSVKTQYIMPETCGSYAGKTENCRLTIVSVDP